jgi:hypothetical protein
MRYPKVYYQMKKIAEIWRGVRDKCTDPAYADMVIEQCESQCLDIECAHLSDDFTGEIEDFEGSEYVGCTGDDEVEEVDFEMEEVAA